MIETIMFIVCILGICLFIITKRVEEIEERIRELKAKGIIK